MSEPWFDPNAYAWIGGTFIGVAGGVIGSLAGVLAPRGKCKGLVMGLHFTVIAISLGLLVAGIIAIVNKQPYGVWYGLMLPGFIGVIVLGSLTPMLFMRYRQAEMNKSLASDL
jgi:hypothetical protein